MIEWFTLAQIVVALVVGLACLVLGGLGTRPNDVSILGSALVIVLLLAQVVVSIVAPFAANAPTGDPVEYWIYLVTALLLPVLAIVWALIDRSRWATVILGVAAITVAVMLYRMNQIWFVQVYTPVV
jgi:drug/metabolite transporter (DMT)-like permease